MATTTAVCTNTTRGCKGLGRAKKKEDSPFLEAKEKIRIDFQWDFFHLSKEEVGRKTREKRGRESKKVCYRLRTEESSEACLSPKIDKPPLVPS